MSKNLQVTA